VRKGQNMGALLAIERAALVADEQSTVRGASLSTMEWRWRMSSATPPVTSRGV